MPVLVSQGRTVRKPDCPHCLDYPTPLDGLVCAFCLGDHCDCGDCRGRQPVQPWLPKRPSTRAELKEALAEWAGWMGLSFDEDNERPELTCSGCGSPINIWEGEEPCPDCDDCTSCCWDNHGGDHHGVVHE